MPTEPPERLGDRYRWERRWRRALVEQARALALGLGLGEPPQVAPYVTGLSVRQGEQVWAETWARCSLDQHRQGPFAAALPPEQWPVSCWALTSERLVGRLSSGHRTGWWWGQLVAYQADLRHERTELHVADAMVTFLGPGAAAIAVAAVWRLHGLAGLLEHPGLAPLRARARGGGR